MNIRGDYLVVGSGASAMAFVDSILTESDATVVMVDRRAVPGGHWNDSYPFVRLHQPAKSYGVVSKELGRDRIETTGLNAGMAELSSGVEITNYYHELMNDVFLPSGRVTYLPLHEYLGDGQVEGVLSGARQTVDHDTLVDATFLTTSVPSTHVRKFEVDAAVVCIPPNELPHHASQHDHITVLGGGKTGCDALTWLLTNGYPAEALRWVVPRDSWFFNRAITQNSVEYFDEVMGGAARQYELLASAATVEEFFLGMEDISRVHRLDEEIIPTMLHAAILSVAELEALRTVPDVVRGRRVSRVEPAVIVFDDNSVQPAPPSLYVDCTASAVEQNVGDLTPVFQPGRINLQMIRQFQPCFSAALIGFIEARIDDPAERETMTRTTPMTDVPADFVENAINSAMNQAAWGQNELTKSWLSTCRLDGPGQLVQQIDPNDTEKWATMSSIAAAVPSALANVEQLLAASALD